MEPRMPTPHLEIAGSAGPDGPDGAPPSGHRPAEVGSFDRERDLAILAMIDGEMTDVEHALRRLDDATYGTCEMCGGPIGDEHLEAMPAARLCAEDQLRVQVDTPDPSASPESG